MKSELNSFKIRQLVKSCEVAWRWGGMIHTFSLASTSTEETISNIYVLRLCVPFIFNQNQNELFSLIQKISGPENSPVAITKRKKKEIYPIYFGRTKNNDMNDMTQKA